MYVYVCVCMYVCMFVCTYVSICKYIYIYTHAIIVIYCIIWILRVCVSYIYIYCIYIYMHIHLYIHQRLCYIHVRTRYMESIQSLFGIVYLQTHLIRANVSSFEHLEASTGPNFWNFFQTAAWSHLQTRLNPLVRHGSVMVLRLQIQDSIFETDRKKCITFFWHQFYPILAFIHMLQISNTSSTMQ